MTERPGNIIPRHRDWCYCIKMNGKAVKLLRKVSSLGGGDLEHLKKIYLKMNHLERGRERLIFETKIREAEEKANA